MFNKIKDEKISEEEMQRFRNFRGVSQFKRAAMNIFVKTID